MKTILILSLTAVALALTGCYGSTDAPTGGSSYALVETTPLPTVPRSAWTVAPAGCEGKLDIGSRTFGVAEGEPALVVVLGASGAIICVDSLESVDIDLRERGDDNAADELCARYLMVIDGVDGVRRETSSVHPREGDPSPQPNMAGSVSIGDDKGDPSPQPNVVGTMGSEESDDETSPTGNTTTRTPHSQSPREGDPSPQPNNQAGSMTAPVTTGSTTTTTSSSGST